MARRLRSPALVAAAVAAAYGLWAGWAHHVGHDWREFADIGSSFVERSDAVPAIAADAPYATREIGYDGQFFLYIARDPRGAVPYVDNASYRYGRIGYPVAARALALGRQDAIPVALVALNVLAVALGAWAVAAWLRRRGLSPWLALLYAAFPGLAFAAWRDLSEPLAYGLTALAVGVLDGSRRRVAAAAALFAAATLTREAAALYALVWAGALAAEGKRLRAAALAAAAVLPYAVWRLVVLRLWLGNVGVPDALRPTPVPFGGIAHYFPWAGPELERVYAVLLPGTLVLALGAYALARGAREPAVWALLANALLFVVFLSAATYGDWKAAGRVSTGVVLAFCLALPALARVLPPTRTWLWVPVVAWFAPWFTLLPAMLDQTWP